MDFGIYKWTNLVTGRVLVGQTGPTQGFSKRKIKYLSPLRKGKYGNTHFQRSFTKHGESNFTFDVIEYHTDDSKLTEREQFWVDHHRALPAGVYNAPGPVKTPMRGADFSAEALEKMRIATTARMAIPENRQRLVDANTGKKQSAETIEKRVSKFRGRKMGQDFSDKMSEIAKNRQPISEETRQRQSDSHKGQKPLPESLAKRSESMKKTLAAKRAAALLLEQSIASASL